MDQPLKQTNMVLLLLHKIEQFLKITSSLNQDANQDKEKWGVDVK